jgi:hypothetical protein
MKFQLDPKAQILEYILRGKIPQTLNISQNKNPNHWIFKYMGRVGLKAFPSFKVPRHDGSSPNFEPWKTKEA